MCFGNGSVQRLIGPIACHFVVLRLFELDIPCIDSIRNSACPAAFLFLSFQRKISPSFISQMLFNASRRIIYATFLCMCVRLDLTARLFQLVHYESWRYEIGQYPLSLHTLIDPLLKRCERSKITGTYRFSVQTSPERYKGKQRKMLSAFSLLSLSISAGSLENNGSTWLVGWEDRLRHAFYP